MNVGLLEGIEDVGALLGELLDGLHVGTPLDGANVGLLEGVEDVGALLDGMDVGIDEEGMLVDGVTVGGGVARMAQETKGSVLDKRHVVYQ